MELEPAKSSITDTHTHTHTHTHTFRELSEHVCSVVLLVLALLLWRWMCLSSPPFHLCYFPCVLWFLRCLLGLVVVVPLFPFPLSLIVVVWCFLSLGSRFLALVELEDPPPC